VGAFRGGFRGLGFGRFAPYRGAYLGGRGFGRYGYGWGGWRGGYYPRYWGYRGYGLGRYWGYRGWGYGLGYPWYLGSVYYPGSWGYGYGASAYPYVLSSGGVYDYGLNDYGPYDYGYGEAPAVDYSAEYAPQDTGGPATTSPAPTDNAAHLTVVVPPDAELWFNGVRMQETGPVREFVSPPMTPGQGYTYQVHARWTADGRTIDETRTVHVQANVQLEVDLTQAQPGDVPRVP
jgi:uncharacterized protein (TIGR03000 family)